MDNYPSKIPHLNNNGIIWSDPELYQRIVYHRAIAIYYVDDSHRRGFHLEGTSEIIPIYTRPMFHKQMKFLIDMLTDDTVEAWVIGELTYLPTII